VISTGALRAAIALPRAPDRAVRLGAWSLALLAAVLVVASRALLAIDPYTYLPHPGPPSWLELTVEIGGSVAGVLIVAGLGAVIVSRQPWNRLGWVFLATSVGASITLFAQEYAVRGLVAAPGTLPGAELAAWAQTWTYHVLLLGVAFVMLLFPNGRLPTRRAVVLVVAATAVTALALVDSMGSSQLLRTSVRDEAYPLPVTMPPGLWAVGFAVARWTAGPIGALQVVILPVAVVELLLRLRRSRADERLQIKWLAYACVLAAVGWLVSFVDVLPGGRAPRSWLEMVDSWADLLWLLGLTVGMPVAIGFAVLRHRLYQIDEVIDRTLLVGGLAVFIAGVYAAVVIGAGKVVGGSFGPELSLVAAAITAIGFAPVRARLRTLVDRLVYGTPTSAYDVLTGFAEQIATAHPGQEMLTLMARLLVELLDTERAEVWLAAEGQARLAASWPPSAGDLDAPPRLAAWPSTAGLETLVPIEEGDVVLGALRIRRRRGDPLGAAQTKLLEDLARQAAQVLRTVRLIEALRASRERIVDAADAERRRLERDLHDGAQQRFLMASITLSLAQARLDGGHAEAADALLADARAQLAQAIAELRDFGRGIHPVILTEVGLQGALRSLAESARVPIELHVEVARRLPQAVESTAYLFVAEAVANAARHAGATAVRVRAWESRGRVHVEVRDDGVGGARPGSGSGLEGLAVRLSALGGTMSIQSPPMGGTRLKAELPCE
jgi:signal transduction histidine kinase